MMVKKDESPPVAWFRWFDRRVADEHVLPARQGLQLQTDLLGLHLVEMADGGIERDDTEIHTALAVEFLGHGHAEERAGNNFPISH